MQSSEPAQLQIQKDQLGSRPFSLLSEQMSRSNVLQRLGPVTHMLDTRRETAIGQCAHCQLGVRRIIFNQQNIGKASPRLSLALKRLVHLLKNDYLRV